MSQELATIILDIPDKLAETDPDHAKLRKLAKLHILKSVANICDKLTDKVLTLEEKVRKLEERVRFM